MIDTLKQIYKNFFINSINIDKYIEALSKEIDNNFDKKKRDFFIECSNQNINLIALEYLLRKQEKFNIFSFVFLRLSALAESLPQNQNIYVNKSKLNRIEIFWFLTTSIITTIILELQRLTLSKKIKEYQNV